MLTSKLKMLKIYLRFRKIHHLISLFMTRIFFAQEQSISVKLTSGKAFLIQVLAPNVNSCI